MNGHVFFIAQNRKILPEIAPRAGIESGGRLVQQQHRGMMQQALGQLQAALHASGKSLRFFVGAVGEANPTQHFFDARLQRGPCRP